MRFFSVSHPPVFFPVWGEQIGILVEDTGAHRGQGFHAGGVCGGLLSRPIVGSLIRQPCRIATGVLCLVEGLLKTEDPVSVLKGLDTYLA